METVETDIERIHAAFGRRDGGRDLLRAALIGSSPERVYRLFPDLRDSNANTFRTSDWEIPNCLAMREGAIPALKVASTAFT
jgi:hypothetical protein